MKQTLRAFAFAAAFSAARLVHAAAQPGVIDLTWGLTVDASGTVTRLDSESQLGPELKDRLEREIRSWRFKPGTIDGRPALTDSKLHLALEVTPIDDERSSLRLIRAGTGAGYRAMTVPRYPEVSVRARRQGLVLLNVRYGEDGRVTELALDENAPHADKALVDAAIAAVKHWTFTPEVVGGRALTGVARVPVCFGLRGTRFVPPKCEWSRPGEPAVAAADDSAPAFDSVLKLETAVAGRTP